MGYFEPLHEFTGLKNHRGIVAPRDEGMLIDSVHFYNYNKGTEGYYALGTCSHCWSCVGTNTGGKTTLTKNLAFTNVTSFIKYETPFRATFMDLDGTLTGFPNCGWAVPYHVHNLVTPHCEDRRWDYDGIICNCDVTIRKILFYDPKPHDEFYYVEARVLRLDNGVDIDTADEE